MQCAPLEFGAWKKIEIKVEQYCPPQPPPPQLCKKIVLSRRSLILYACFFIKNMSIVILKSDPQLHPLMMLMMIIFVSKGKKNPKLWQEAVISLCCRSIQCQCVFFIIQVAFSMDINSIHDDSSPFPSAIKSTLEGMYKQLFQCDFEVSLSRI